MQPQVGVGRLYKESLNRGDMDKGREETTYQHIRTDGCRTSCENLHEKQESILHSLADRQHSSPILSYENGWELTKISKRIWHYLLDKEITLTAEWIPTQLNIVP